MFGDKSVEPRLRKAALSEFVAEIEMLETRDMKSAASVQVEIDTLKGQEVIDQKALEETEANIDAWNVQIDGWGAHVKSLNDFIVQIDQQVLDDGAKVGADQKTLGDAKAVMPGVIGKEQLADGPAIGQVNLLLYNVNLLETYGKALDSACALLGKKGGATASDCTVIQRVLDSSPVLAKTLPVNVLSKQIVAQSASDRLSGLDVSTQLGGAMTRLETVKGVIVSRENDIYAKLDANEQAIIDADGVSIVKTTGDIQTMATAIADGDKAITNQTTVVQMNVGLVASADSALATAAQSVTDAKAVLANAVGTTAKNAATAALTLAQRNYTVASTLDNRAKGYLRIEQGKLNSLVSGQAVRQKSLVTLNTLLVTENIGLTAHVKARQGLHDDTKFPLSQKAMVDMEAVVMVQANPVWVRDAAAYTVRVTAQGVVDAAQAVLDGDVVQQALDVKTASDARDDLSVTKGKIGEANDQLIAKIGEQQYWQGIVDGELSALNTLEEEETRLQQDEESQALAQSLGFSVARTLEAEANKIGYAKMFVSAENLPNQDTQVTVRFRNPGASTFIGMRMDRSGYGEIVSDAPIADGSILLTFRPSDAAGPAFTFYLEDGKTRQILQQVSGSYDRYGRSVSLDAQMPFEKNEQGMLAENPIVPDVQVQSIQGPNILLAVQSPHDQTNLYFPNVAGMLSHQQLNHVGGTTYMPAMLTFDGTQPTGDYDLNMGDGSSGLVDDVIHLHWDKGSKSLSLTNAKDQYTGDQSTPDGLKDFQAIMSLTTVVLGDQQINWIQKSRIYEQTAALPAPYNFSAINLTQRIYDAHPEYNPINWNASIDALWNQIGHGYTRGRAEQMFQSARVDYINQKAQQLNVYSDIMGNLMQQAVNALVQIRQGGNQTQLINGVQQAIDGYNNVNHIKAQNYTASQLAGLQELGISIPSSGMIMNAAHTLLDSKWKDMVGAIADVAAHQHYQDVQRANGLRQKANGEWVAVSQNTTVDTTNLNNDQLRLATKIARAMQSSTKLLALYSAAQKATIATGIGSVLTASASTDEIANAIRVMMNSPDVKTANVLDGMGGEKISADQDAAAKIVNPQSQRTLFANALQWYNSANNALGNTFMIRTDTFVGKIMAGAANKLWTDQSMEQKWETAFIIQRITDIPATKVIDIWTTGHSSKQVFSDALMALMHQAQYDNLFESPSTSGTATFIGAHPDIPLSSGKTYDGTSQVRIRFDIANAGKDLERVEIYDGTQPVGRTSASAFIDIPFYQSRANITLTVRAIFRDNTIIETTTDAFSIMPKSGAELLANALNLSTATDAKERDIENSIFAEIGNHTPFNAGDGTWYALIGSGAHDGPAFNALDINLTTNDLGKDVLAIADGTIGDIKLAYGTIIVDQPAIDLTPAWQSKYLHTPLFDTGRKADNGNIIYGFYKNANNDVETGLEIWVGKSVKAGDRIGIIGNKDTLSPHEHFEILLNNQSINIGQLAQKIWKIEIKGSDGGDASGDTVVDWHPELATATQSGFWGNKDTGLVFFRDQTITNDSDTDYWMAWEGSDMTKMQRVELLNIGTPQKPVMRWITSTPVEAGKDVWDTKTKKWFTRSESLLW